MKKAVISTGSKQYLVAEGEQIEVELLKSENSKVSFPALLIIDEKQIEVGAPEVKNATVSAEVVSADKQDDKVTSIRYKAKKRVHTVRGHRQHKTVLKIVKIG